MGNGYELLDTGSFPCPCGEGRVRWQRRDYDDHVTDGPGSPTLECEQCDLVLWNRPDAGTFYIRPSDKDELENLEATRWELSRALWAVCEERYGGPWAAKLSEVRDQRGAVRDLLRKAGGLARLGSDSSIARHLKLPAASIASDSLRVDPLGVLRVLDIDDPEVRARAEEAEAAHAKYHARQDELCTEPVPVPST